MNTETSNAGTLDTFVILSARPFEDSKRVMANESTRIRDGIDELADAYAKYGLTYDDFLSSRFVRLRRIRELQSAGVVDDMLRRTVADFPAVGARAGQASS